MTSTFGRSLLVGGVLMGLIATPALAASPSTVAARGEATPKTFLSATTQVGRDQRFRATFGLNTDPHFIASLIAGRSLAVEQRQEWGVFLTPAETADMSHRMEVDHAIQNPAFQRYIHAQSDFAGIWTDQRNGGVVNVLFTKSSSPLRLSTIQELLPFGDQVRVVRVSRTEAELESIQSHVVAARATLADHGISLSKVAVDTPHNGIAVGVTSQPSTALATLQGLFGSAIVSVEQVDVSETYQKLPCDMVGQNTPKCGYVDTPPFGGGDEIVDNVNGAICSAGFPVYSPNSLNFNLSNFYILTAGHCMTGSASDPWVQEVTPMGTVAANGVPISRDGMIININTHPGIIDTVLLYATPVNSPTYVQVNHAQAQDGDYVGEPMCQAGISSNYNCGDEAIHNESVCYPNNQCFTYMREASYGSIPGDSGGPNFDSTAAVGITSGNATYTFGNSQDIFQHIYDELTALGVQFYPYNFAS